MDVTWNDFVDWAERNLAPLGLKVLAALAVFFVGRSLARLVVRTANRVMERSQMDLSLRKFLTDVMYAILLVAVITAALGTVGIQTTAVVTVLGAAGLAVGLALQGSLSNFAAGVMIIVLRPYKVGDHVVIGKYLGRVEVVKVFHTILVTGDNREVTIPNGKIVTDPIENLTALGTRRIDLVISVAHGTDLHQTRQWLEGAALADERVQASPAPVVQVAEIGADAVKLLLRPWTRGGDHGAVAAAMMERIKATLDGHQVRCSVALQ